MSWTRRKRIVTGLMALVLSVVAVAPSSAIPLAGDYLISSGPMLGSTFTIDASTHLFTHWNIAFPAEPNVSLPAKVYTDADAPFVNLYIPEVPAETIRLQFVRVNSFPILSTSLFHVIPNPTYGGFYFAAETYRNVLPNTGRATPDYSGYFVPTNVVPEPNLLTLCLLGLLGLVGVSWWTGQSRDRTITS